MGIFFSWLILSFIVGLIGSGRRITFFGAFILSLLLSPLIGLIITLISKNKQDELYKKQMLQMQMIQQTSLNNLSTPPQAYTSVVEELEKLQKLKDSNLLTEEEFQTLKNKILK